jgi:hypothetical protein
VLSAEKLAADYLLFVNCGLITEDGVLFRQKPGFMFPAIIKSNVAIASDKGGFMDALAYAYAALAAIGVGAIVYARVVVPLLEAFGIDAPLSGAFYDKPQTPQTAQTAQTDRPDSPSAASEPTEAPRNLTERTIPAGDRGALVEALVINEWGVGQIRGVLKGDNGVISAEVAAARERLGLPATPRTITISRHGEPVQEVEL